MLMGKKKKRKKSHFGAISNKSENRQGSNFNESIPDISDSEMMEAIAEIQNKNPGMIGNIFKELDRWREEFVKENGREPSEEDLLEIFDEDNLDDFDDFDPDVDVQETPEICRTCGWCLKEIKDDEERFSFGVKTKFDVVPNKDPTQPLIMSLSNGKQIKTIITTLDSPARKEGFQLLVMCCSESCIVEAQKGLQSEIDIDNISILN